MKQFGLTDNLCFSSGTLHQPKIQDFFKDFLFRPHEGVQTQSLCPRLVVQQPLNNMYQKNVVFILINTGLVNVKVC